MRELLRQATETLTSYGIEDARTEAELLLREVLKLDKVQFYLELDKELSPEQVQTLNDMLQRRSRREPLAYILGHREFFGLEFYVDYRILIPRPETELLVEQAVEIANRRFPQSCLIGDIGTGCGAIAISLAASLPQAIVYATDISAPALEVAFINCQRHGVADRVHLLQGDLFNPIAEPLDIIVANLPYVKNSEVAELDAEIRLFEPMMALAGGDDGLEWIRRLLSQVGGKLRNKGAIIIEISPGQAATVIDLAQNLFPQAKARIAKDLSGLDRALIVERL